MFASRPPRAPEGNPSFTKPAIRAVYGTPTTAPAAGSPPCSPPPALVIDESPPCSPPALVIDESPPGSPPALVIDESTPGSPPALVIDESPPGSPPALAVDEAPLSRKRPSELNPLMPPPKRQGLSALTELHSRAAAGRLLRVLLDERPRAPAAALLDEQQSRAAAAQLLRALLDGQQQPGAAAGQLLGEQPGEQPGEQQPRAATGPAHAPLSGQQKWEPTRAPLGGQQLWISQSALHREAKVPVRTWRWHPPVGVTMFYDRLSADQRSCADAFIESQRIEFQAPYRSVRYPGEIKIIRGYVFEVAPLGPAADTIPKAIGRGRLQKDIDDAHITYSSTEAYNLHAAICKRINDLVSAIRMGVYGKFSDGVDMAAVVKFTVANFNPRIRSEVSFRYL